MPLWVDERGISRIAALGLKENRIPCILDLTKQSLLRISYALFGKEIQELIIHSFI
jgi:hypothetical protein